MLWVALLGLRGTYVLDYRRNYFFIVLFLELCYFLIIVINKLYIVIQWWFVYPDTFVPGRYFSINKFSGLLNRPLVRMWKSAPTLFVRTSEISGLSEPILTNHHCKSFSVRKCDIYLWHYNISSIVKPTFFKCSMVLLILWLLVWNVPWFCWSFDYWFEMFHGSVDPLTTGLKCSMVLAMLWLLV